MTEVIVRTRAAVECEGQARMFSAKAKKNEEKAKAAEAEEAAAAKAAAEKSEPCPTCEDLQAQVKALRTARREAAKAAGTWAKKGRGERKNSTKAKKRANEKKVSAEESKERCIEKKNKILAKLQGAGAV